MKRNYCTLGRFAGCAALLTAALAVGCVEQITYYRENDAFPPDDAVRPIHEMTRGQLVAGARADAMLYDVHFDGTKLNDLGRQKIEFLIDDEDVRSQVFVVPDGDDARAAARAADVRAYLSEAGVENVGVTVGWNPTSKFAAAPQIARLSKTESSGESGGGGSAGGAGSSGGAAGGATGK